jgi:cell wall-associated NlpC family hydrolase
MTNRILGLLTALTVSVAVTGCATGGRVPRPQPFPGANPPAVGRDEPDPATSHEAENVTASALLSTALNLRGTPYLNGGSHPDRGFDCSGFVQWVFAQHGTLLPREVREQYREGTRVAPDEVQPGDLLFFETVSGGPSHVGIALGSGEFVHAPSSRGVVRIERYTSRYWARRWVGARRISSRAEFRTTLP